MSASNEFIHWSAEPLAVARLESRNPVHEWKRDKPHGLWFSVGDGPDGWRDWCEQNDFALNSFVWRNVINFRGDAKILRISGAKELDALTAEYRHASAPNWADRVLAEYAIDWARVGERYQGIIIAPYCWSRRLGLGWYYTWDCASGCVWDVAAIESISASRAQERVAA
jgi:hypothetical protein